MACAAAHAGPLAARAAGQGSVGSPVPWDELGRQLRSRYTDPRRHFVFEYYPWYANAPYRHWQQWGREPPVDLASNHVPLLGAYDSRSTAVIEQHARWIVESGVGVVDLSWWGRGSFSDRAVSRVMDVMAAHDIKVTFHLEPYGELRVSNLAADVQYLLDEFGEKRRWDCFFLHQRADGREGPVFKLFATTLPSHLEDCHGVWQPIPAYAPDGVWRRATDRVHAQLAREFSHATLLTDTGDARRAAAAGFDGIATYDPALEPEDALDPAVTASQLGMLFSFSVNPGRDEIERRKVEPGSCYRPRSFLPRTRDLDWTRPDDRELARQLSEQRVRQSLETTVQLQMHPWLGNVEAGFFLTYITSFNEWHEGTSFEPMKDDAELSVEERAIGYHNPADGHYRVDVLRELLARLT